MAGQRGRSDGDQSGGARPYVSRRVRVRDNSAKSVTFETILPGASRRIPSRAERLPCYTVSRKKASMTAIRITIEHKVVTSGRSYEWLIAALAAQLGLRA